VAEWRTQDARQAARIERMHAELERLLQRALENVTLGGRYPWRRLAEWAEENTSEESQELLNSLMMEPYGELVDGFADEMTDPETTSFDPRMRLGQLCELIERHYSWALGIDFARPEAQRFFWYCSEEKEEPRLGERFCEAGAELEMRLGIARDVSALYRILKAPTAQPQERLATFLLRCPEWRHVAWRVQIVDKNPYGEIRDNLLGADCMPIDILRCKLSFFGAIKFDPKSDRWTRITMYQGAPRFAGLDNGSADGWFLPVFLAVQTSLCE
jgi:hypothetical protein